VPGTQVRTVFFLLFFLQPIFVVTSATDGLLVDARTNVTPILPHPNALLATLGTKKRSTQLQLGERTRKQSDWVRAPKLCCIESNASELVHEVWGQTVRPGGKHLVEALKRPFPASRRCRKTKQARADGVPQRKALAVWTPQCQRMEPRPGLGARGLGRKGLKLAQLRLQSCCQWRVTVRL